MLRRVDGDERNASLVAAAGLSSSEPVVAAAAESDFEQPLLPHDHPKWVKDALTVSRRAGDCIARLRPVAIRVLTFWDHRIRSIVVGGARVNVDPSGSYSLR